MRIPMFTLLLWITAATPIGLASAAELAPAGSQTVGRFSGTAGLIAPPPTSADGRFSLNAELHAATTPTIAKSSDRFSLLAQIQPSASTKALSTACGPVVDALFKNGFE